MKSRISFFNGTAFRKDIVRYSPVWALYTLFLLLVLFGFLEFNRISAAANILDSLKVMVWINLIYGGVCAVSLFSDLFKGRLCNTLHAFPLRREGWLTTHLVSGFTFSFVPNLLATILGSILLQEYAYMALIWLAGSMLQYLFFFGTAVLSVMCAGNVLGTAAIYGIIHFVTMLAYSVVELLYQPLLFGVRVNTEAFYRFFPLDQLDGYNYAEFTVCYDKAKPYGLFEGLNGEAWLYLGLCAAAGVLCIVLAYGIYRRRNLESAGDFLSLRGLSPVFLVAFTIASGLFLYTFSDLVGNGTYFFLALGVAVGYFIGSMFLYRTVKVFGKKSLLRFAVLVIALAGSLGLTWLDPLGITTYIPKTEDIKAVSIWGADKGYYYLAESLSSYVGTKPNEVLTITDLEELTQLQDYHEQLIKYRHTNEDGVLCDVSFQYTLKNGRVITRHYEIGRYSALARQAALYFSDMRYVFEVDDPAVLYDAFDAITLDIYDGKENVEIKITDPVQISNLLEVIRRDCEAGKMAQNWAMHSEDSKKTEINLGFNTKDSVSQQIGWDTDHFYLHLYPDCDYTIDYVNYLIEFHSEAE